MSSVTPLCIIWFGLSLVFLTFVLLICEGVEMYQEGERQRRKERKQITDLEKEAPSQMEGITSEGTVEINPGEGFEQPSRRIYEYKPFHLALAGGFFRFSFLFSALVLYFAHVDGKVLVDVSPKNGTVHS
jgi:hypothetical protein